MKKGSFIIAALLCLSFVTAYGQDKKTTKVAAPSKAIIAAGKAVYAQNCESCHQFDGGGVQDLNPPLIKTRHILGEKSYIISVVLKGLSRVEIEGERYSNVMPPLDYLTDKQIADALTYVRNSFGNNASAVSEAEVKAVRAKK